MLLIADGLLIAGAFAAGFYCWVLSRRVRGLTDLDNGVGAAISALSRQVDEVKNSLDVAKAVTGASRKELAELTARAEISAGRLELLLASLHEQGEVSPEGGDRLRRAVGRRRGVRSDGGARVVETASASTNSDDLGESAHRSRQATDDDETGQGGFIGRREVTPALENVLKAMER